MWEWIVNNLSTILVSLVLLGLLGGIVWSMIRKKKRGEISCGCGCSNCAMNGTCHAAKTNKEE